MRSQSENTLMQLYGHVSVECQGGQSTLAGRGALSDIRTPRDYRIQGNHNGEVRRLRQGTTIRKYSQSLDACDAQDVEAERVPAQPCHQRGKATAERVHPLPADYDKGPLGLFPRFVRLPIGHPGGQQAAARSACTAVRTSPEPVKTPLPEISVSAPAAAAGPMVSGLMPPSTAISIF